MGTMPSRQFSPVSWQDDAACIGADVNLFYPAKGGSKRERQAKKLCASCPVQQKCLDYAMQSDEEWGIWGGLLPSEREALKESEMVA